MLIVIILAHPNKDSFNHAIAHTAIDVLTANGHAVYFHDLYAEQFDPLLPYHEFEKDAQLPPEIEGYCHEISSADGIIIVHPKLYFRVMRRLCGLPGDVSRDCDQYYRTTPGVAGNSPRNCQTILLTRGKTLAHPEWMFSQK